MKYTKFTEEELQIIADDVRWRRSLRTPKSSLRFLFTYKIIFYWSDLLNDKIHRRINSKDV